MKDISIVICDEDLQYAKTLVQGFQRANQFIASYIIVSEQQKMLKYIKDEAVTVFLVAEKAYSQTIKAACEELEQKDRERLQQKIIIISEVQNHSYEPMLSVYKYQSISGILEPINGWIKEHEREQEGIKGHTKIIGVLAVADSGSASLMGHMIGKSYSEHQKTMLVNMEVFPFCYQPVETPYNLSDYIYAVATSSEMTSQIAAGMQYKNGNLTCITASVEFSDLYELDGERVPEFLEQLRGSMDADVIVVAMDFLRPFVLELLSVCDTIILKEPSNLVEDSRRNQLYRLLETEKKEWIQDKLIYCNATTEYLAANILSTGELTEQLKMTYQGWLSSLVN